MVQVPTAAMLTEVIVESLQHVSAYPKRVDGLNLE